MAKQPNTTTVSSKPTVTEEPGLFDWDQVVKRASAMPDILPRLTFEPNDVATVTIVSARPNIVEYEDKESGEHKKFPVVEIIHHDDSNARKTMAVSAISLQNAIGKIAAKRGGSLEDAKVRITCITYTHPKYGKTKGYRAESLDEESDA